MLSSIQTLSPKKLIGQHATMSLVNNKTFQLWGGFMPRRKEITNKVNTEFISMQVYHESYSFSNFDFAANFEKWATVEVADFDIVPDGMETFSLEGGLYAVFLHKGPASAAEKTFRYIFMEWLPNSEYALDNRPHFEIIGEKYKHDSEDSEEEVWIPIRKK